MTTVYLLLGLALMGGLFYALTQITARQRRLNAELTRLERLAAEVSMNAEAIFEQVDERMGRLDDLVKSAQGRVDVSAVAPQVQKETPAQAPTLPPPTSMQKYQEVRAAVWTLADRGDDPITIAQALGIPRGEVQLMLNIRGRKVTA